MDFRFPSVFNEDETMWIDADVVYHHWFPPQWQRVDDGSSLSLYIQ